MTLDIDVNYTGEEDLQEEVGWRSSKKSYYRRVWKLTERAYQAKIDEINPARYTRGTEWQLDHMFSIAEGFKRLIEPEIIASRTNLEMLPALDNSVKGEACSLGFIELLDRYMGFPLRLGVA